MRKIVFLYFIFYLCFYHLNFAQNTVGTINNTAQAINGFTLFTISTETYLINNCGEVINQWSSNYPPGNAVYLLENGNLLRACQITNPDITIAGIGGRIELYNWDGILLWSYNYSTDQTSQHHDIYPMPNGNILMLAVSIMSNTEAIQAGRNPANLQQSQLYNEQIIEVEPTGSNTANIVWEWNIKDHLIQDFDNTKSNFANVASNPQLLNINYLGSNVTGNANWLHFNSMQYNETLDQIVISSRILSEIYIIDHSTTTLESASHLGGNYGKGGDILYRWGNPQAYNQGTTSDQQLFGQHYPHFIKDGLPNAGKIIVFNNGTGRQPPFSEIFILSPPTSSAGVYSYVQNTSYGPSIPDYIYIDPIDKTNFLAKFISGAQQLPNGNILICDGDSGYFFEIDANENKVWEYISPVSNTGILYQGDAPFSANVVFRAHKYEPNYAAFSGRDLTPRDPIELMPDLTQCSILNVTDNDFSELSLYPNPTRDMLNINTISEIDKIEVYNLLGGLVIDKHNSKSISLKNFSSGLYIIKIYSNNVLITKKIIKE